LLSAVRALPGVASHDDRSAARHQVVETVEDALHPWKQVQELYDALTDGHAWYASGQVAGAALFRFRGARGSAVGRFGTHDALPNRVMLALDRGARALEADGPVDVWLAEHLRREFVRALQTFENMPLPLLDDLELHGVDLVHQEAAGGHTLQRHVGRDVDFLRDRQREEYGPDGNPRAYSSFATLDEAERLVTDALRANLPGIRAFLADPHQTRVRILAPLEHGAGTVLDARGELTDASEVAVVLTKVDGTVRVQTAYLNP